MEENVSEVSSEATPNESIESNSFTVPEGYTEKGWAKDVKSVDDLWKLTDNAQTLIGKRPAGIPDFNTASEEEINKFYQSVGRPETADQYQLPEVEGLPDGTDIAPWKEKASNMFHKVGLNDKQAGALWEMYLEDQKLQVAEMQTGSAEQQAALDKQFDELTQKHFGDQWEAKSQATQAFINENVPEDLQGVFGELENHPKALAALIATVDAAQNKISAVEKEYGKEGKITTGDSSTPSNIDEVRSELTSLRRSESATDPLHPEHNKTIDRINMLSGKVQSFYRNT